MSDTPETDCELNHKSFIYTMGGLPTDVVHVEFARKLERERDAYKDKLLSYKNALLKINILSDDDCPDFALDSIKALTHKTLK